MIRIETIEVAGLAGALTALRLPFGKEARSKVVLDYDWSSEIKDAWFDSSTNICIDDRDLALMQTLVKRGDEHAKVVRGINVWAKIYAPIFLLREIETYRFGRERLASESTMHQQCRGLSGDELVKAKSELPMGTMQLTVDMFSYQTLRRIVIQRSNHRLPEWHQFIDWIKTLPLADELIFCGLNEDN